MACLRSEAGFPFRAAVHAYSLMDSYVYGFALQEKTMTGDIPAEARRRGSVVADRDASDAERYPYLLEVMFELSRTGAQTDGDPHDNSKRRIQCIKKS